MTVIHLAEMVLKVADGGGQFLACFPPGRPPSQASFHFFEQSGGTPTLLLEPTPTLFEPFRAGLPAGTNTRRRTPPGNWPHARNPESAAGQTAAAKSRGLEPHRPSP